MANVSYHYRKQGALTVLLGETRVSLYPGKNEMTQEEWASIEDNPSIEALLESKDLVIDEPKKTAKVAKSTAATTEKAS